MTRRSQIAAGLLAAVLLLFVYVIYTNRQPVAVAAARGAAQSFVPLPVENPALRMDLLEQLKKFEYEGPRRNIFSTGAACRRARTAATPAAAGQRGPHAVARTSASGRSSDIFRARHRQAQRRQPRIF